MEITIRDLLDSVVRGSATWVLVAQWSAQQRLTGVQKVAGSIPSVTQKFSVKNFLVGEFEAEC